MKRIIFILLTTLLISCINNNNPFGVYQARFKEKETIHYVELFPDSTFCQVYEKNGNRNLHKGNFRLFPNGKYSYIIDFDDWKDFDERSIEYKKRYLDGINVKSVLLNKGQIFFDMDLYELNFKKE